MPKTTRPSGQALSGEQSVAMHKTTQPSGQALSGERKLAVSGSALDHTAHRAGPMWLVCGGYLVILKSANIRPGSFPGC